MARRAFAASLLTAVIGGVQNWLYERFFAPDLYATGPPLARAIWAIVFSFPFILAGLLLLGLPVAFLLRRARAENSLTYAVTGAAGGCLWSTLIGFDATNYGIALAAFYGCACALFWWWLRPKANV